MLGLVGAALCAAAWTGAHGLDASGSPLALALAGAGLFGLALAPATALFALARWRECARELRMRGASIKPGSGEARPGRALRSIGIALLALALLASTLLAVGDPLDAILLVSALALPGAALLALGKWREAALLLRALRGPAASERSSAPRVPPRVDARWIAPGESCAVGGFTLPGGMLYVGGSLPAASGAGPEPALLDPALRVERGASAGRRAAMWRSYAGLTPAERGLYLAWLASGRRDERAEVGCALLFLLGLERRVLLDAEQGLASASEVEAIARELERLIRRYGADARFRASAQSLLDFAWVRHLAELEPEPPALERASERKLPVLLLLGLGRFVARGEAIPYPWARAWLHFAGEERLPTSARRSPEEFEVLLRARFPADFGSTLGRARMRTGVRARHAPLSEGFAGKVFEAQAPLPNLAQRRQPVRELEALARACGEELEAWARWRARAGPEARAGLGALALLPSELLDRRDDPALEALRKLCARTLDGPGFVPERELVELWSERRAGALGKRESAELARLLSRLGVGIEPDLRFGGPRLRGEGRALLFRIPADAPHAPSRAYQAATLALELASAVAGADGGVSDEELARMEHHLERSLELCSGERERLRMHLRWLLEEQHALGGLKRRVAELEPGERERSARFLVELVGADGRIDAEEVRVLERVYALLGLDPAAVHRDLHALGAGTLASSSGRPDRAPGAPPERAERPSDAGVVLDRELLERKLAETARASALIGAIFAEEPEEEEEPAEPGPEVPRAPSRAAGAASTATRIGALDAAQSAFARELAARASWARDELEQLARSHGLLPDGALELVNEEAWARCDAPLWEGQDPIDIDPAVAAELLR